MHGDNNGSTLIFAPNSAAYNFNFTEVLQFFFDQKLSYFILAKIRPTILVKNSWDGLL